MIWAIIIGYPLFGIGINDVLGFKGQEFSLFANVIYYILRLGAFIGLLYTRGRILGAKYLTRVVLAGLGCLVLSILFRTFVIYVSCDEVHWFKK